MPNNFRLTADRYVAKPNAGNDSNDGLTKETPKATFQHTSGTANYVIGTGEYDSFATAALVNYTIFADGKVIFKDNYTGTTGISELNGVTVINCTIDTAAGNRGTTFNNCIVDNCNFNTNNGRLSFFESIIKNVDLIDCRTTNSGTNTQRLNIYINCLDIYIDALDGIKDCYIDEVATLYLENGSADFFSNNNIQGVIAFDSSLFSDVTTRRYAIQDQLAGTPQDNGYDIGVNWLTETQLTSDGFTGTISGWDASIATCFNRDPRFNNPELGDYSLQSDSPHIGSASDNSNIGGTEPRRSINVSDIDSEDVDILPSTEIDTSIPNSFKLLDGETEGYVDFIYKEANIPIKVGKITVLSSYNLNSDEIGGSVGNNNVPDSEPLTSEYPDKLTTTGAGGNDTTLTVASHGRSVGEFVRVLGQDREITSVTTDTIVVGTAFRSEVGSGVEFQVGSEDQLKTLRPNRLTFQFRGSNQLSKPTIDSQWDTDIDPVYGMAGEFLTIEIGEQPLYYKDLSNNVYGSGDSSLPDGLEPNEISVIWRNVRVYIRNDYGS